MAYKVDIEEFQVDNIRARGSALGLWRRGDVVMKRERVGAARSDAWFEVGAESAGWGAYPAGTWYFLASGLAFKPLSEELTGLTLTLFCLINHFPNCCSVAVNLHSAYCLWFLSWCLEDSLRVMQFVIDLSCLLYFHHSYSLYQARQVQILVCRLLMYDIALCPNPVYQYICLCDIWTVDNVVDFCQVVKFTRKNWTTEVARKFLK